MMVEQQPGEWRSSRVVPEVLAWGYRVRSL
jgi:hypothetical protein